MKTAARQDGSCRAARHSLSGSYTEVSERSSGKAKGVELGVSLRCAPGRAARAVGNDTAVANRAGPPPRHASPRFRDIGAGAAASRPSGRASLTHRGGSDPERSLETRYSTE